MEITTQYRPLLLNHAIERNIKKTRLPTVSGVIECIFKCFLFLSKNYYFPPTFIDKPDFYLANCKQ